MNYEKIDFEVENITYFAKICNSKKKNGEKRKILKKSMEISKSMHDSADADTIKL